MKPSKRVQGNFGPHQSKLFSHPQIAKVERHYIIFCKDSKGKDYILGYNHDFTDGVFITLTSAKQWWNSSKSDYQGQQIESYY